VKARKAIENAQKFFGARIWAKSEDEVRRSRLMLYRSARILYATVQGGREQRLNFRAAALTYFSVLSIVPFLAFAFSLLKGFGGYQRLMDQSVRPLMQSTFGESPNLLSALEQVLSFVERTSVSSLGAIGILLLGYTSISLLSNIETALNDIWGAKTARPLLRQVTDYTTLIVITPLLVLAAITFSTAAQSSGVLAFLRERLALGLVIDLLLKLTSVVLGCAALIGLYLLMPNVKTKLSSAAFGGVIGGVLWQGLLVLHVKFQMGVASYNALYSGFAAVPIFLVWMYMSWRIVLLGAQLAASHQREQHMQQIQRARHVDQELRETLAVAMTSLAAARFLAQAAAPTQADLATLLQAPVPTVDEVLDTLVRRGILLRSVCGSELGHVPGRDIDELRLADITAAVRVDPAAEDLKKDVMETLDPRLVRLVANEARLREGNLTLRELAKLAPSPAPAPAPDATESVVDAKQPEVTS
jgi:membrane protein